MKLAHISAVCSSKTNADRFYKEIVGLQEIKSFEIDSELINAIFGISSKCLIVLYGNDDFTVEIFIPEKMTGIDNPYAHHCLEVEKKDEFLYTCSAAGLIVNLIPKGDKELSFVRDFDGNYFEIK